VKHVQAGLVVGGVFVALALVVSFIWWFFSVMLGPIAATVFVVAAIAIAVIVGVIDYKTEAKT